MFEHQLPPGLVAELEKWRAGPSTACKPDRRYCYSLTPHAVGISLYYADVLQYTLLFRHTNGSVRLYADRYTNHKPSPILGGPVSCVLIGTFEDMLSSTQQLLCLGLAQCT